MDIKMQITMLRSKILLMAFKAQLNDESFNFFLTQKTNLGQKSINLMSLSGNFFFCSWCKAWSRLVLPVYDR